MRYQIPKRCVFKIDDDDARKMVSMTLGYPFAFQVLGYLTWEHNGKYNEVIAEYRQYLEDYVYDKIWSEMSPGDHRLAYGIAKSQSGKVSDVREILGIDTNEFNPYRKRLIRKGIVDGEQRGYVRFVLPYFDMFVLDNYY